VKKKLWIMSFLFVVLVVGGLSTYLLYSNNSIQSKEQEDLSWDMLTQEQLIQEMKKENVTIVDLREPFLYKKSHVPGAINIPFAKFKDRYKEINKEERVLFVCHTGPMGDASSQLLLEKGYTDVGNLKGGMAQWDGPVQ
jgi:rhodanese-related sulfurtransferase